MGNEKLIEGLRGVQKLFLNNRDSPNSIYTLLDQAIAALSTEAIDVERLRELIVWLDRKWSRHKEEEDLEAANMLRQLLRIAEGERK